MENQNKNRYVIDNKNMIHDLELNRLMGTVEILNILNKYDKSVKHAQEMMKNSKILRFAQKHMKH